jgi:hypothetical protein
VDIHGRPRIVPGQYDFPHPIKISLRQFKQKTAWERQ